MSEILSEHTVELTEIIHAVLRAIRNLICKIQMWFSRNNVPVVGILHPSHYKLWNYFILKK